MLRSREAWIWIAGLTGLVVLAPSLDNHVTICIPSALGIEFCPGCGLGASISHLVRGEFAESWASHPLAVPTLAILIGRIIHLFRQERNNTTKENYNG